MDCLKIQSFSHPSDKQDLNAFFTGKKYKLRA